MFLIRPDYGRRLPAVERASLARGSSPPSGTQGWQAATADAPSGWRCVRRAALLRLEEQRADGAADVLGGVLLRLPPHPHVSGPLDLLGLAGGRREPHL